MSEEKINELKFLLQKREGLTEVKERLDTIISLDSKEVRVSFSNIFMHEMFCFRDMPEEISFALKEIIEKIESEIVEINKIIQSF